MKIFNRGNKEERTISFNLFRRKQPGFSAHIGNVASEEISFSTLDMHYNNTSLSEEEAVNTIIDYFNAQRRLNNKFNGLMMELVENTDFVYLSEAEMLKNIVDEYAKAFAVNSSEGLKQILDAFYFREKFEKTDEDAEDADFILIESNPEESAYPHWLDQTIEEPWFA